jgi:hypothetical protein
MRPTNTYTSSANTYTSSANTYTSSDRSRGHRSSQTAPEDGRGGGAQAPVPPPRSATAVQHSYHPATVPPSRPSTAVQRTAWDRLAEFDARRAGFPPRESTAPPNELDPRHRALLEQAVNELRPPPPSLRRSGRSVSVSVSGAEFQNRLQESGDEERGRRNDRRRARAASLSSDPGFWDDLSAREQEADATGFDRTRGGFDRTGGGTQRSYSSDPRVPIAQAELQGKYLELRASQQQRGQGHGRQNDSRRDRGHQNDGWGHG